MFKKNLIILVSFLVPVSLFGMEQVSLKNRAIETIVENIQSYTPENIAILPTDMNTLLIPKAVLSTIGPAPCVLERSFEAHQAANCCACLTPDNYLITGSQDHSLRVFDASGKMHAQCSGHTAEVWSVCVSNDNKIVSGSADHTVRIWDRQGNLLKTCIGHTDEVHGVCITKDNLIVSCSQDHTVRVWDMEGNQKFQYNGHTSEVWAVCMSLDGNIISGASDGTIHICTVAGDFLAQCLGHADAVHVLSISQDNTIISGSMDWSVRVWDMNGNQLARHTKHRAAIISLCVTPDNQIVSGAHDKTIRVIDMSGEELGFCKTVSSPTSVFVISKNQLMSGSINGDISFYTIAPIHYLKNINAKYAARLWEFLQLVEAMLATGYIEKLNALACWDRIKAIKDQLEAEELQEFYAGLEPLVGNTLELPEVPEDFKDGGLQPMDIREDVGFEEILNQPVALDTHSATEEQEQEQAPKRLKQDH